MKSENLKKILNKNGVLSFKNIFKKNKVSSFRKKFIKTLLAFLFFIGNWYLDVILVILLNERSPIQLLPLPDVAFDFLPEWHPAIYLVELYTAFILLCNIVLFLSHRKGYRIAQRFFIVTGMAFFLRAICISWTTIPVPGVRDLCYPTISSNVTNLRFAGDVLQRSFTLMRTLEFSLLFGRKYFCGAYINSQNAIILINGYGFLNLYSIPRRNRIWFWIDKLLLLNTYIAVILILVSRIHYLIDIVFAYYVSHRTFTTYHTVCFNEQLHHSREDNMFTRFWWWGLFVFFELEQEPFIPFTDSGDSDH